MHTKLHTCTRKHRYTHKHTDITCNGLTRRPKLVSMWPDCLEQGYPAGEVLDSITRTHKHTNRHINMNKYIHIHAHLHIVMCIYIYTYTYKTMPCVPQGAWTRTAPSGKWWISQHASVDVSCDLFILYFFFNCFFIHDSSTYSCHLRAKLS